MKILVTKQNSNKVTKVAEMLVWLLQLPPVPFMKLGKRIRSLIKENGTDFTVLYLKECHKILQSYIAGNRIDRSDQLVGIKQGIPTIIPVDLFPLIRERDSRIVRGVLSMLQLYRVFYAEPVLKLGSITQPFKGLSTTLNDANLERSVREFRSRFWKQKVQRVQDKIIPLVSAGPSSKVSLEGMGANALRLSQEPILDSALKYFFPF